MLSKTRLNTISNTSTNRRLHSIDNRNYKRPTYITLTDFMRIQNEINPINAEYENRKAYERKLKKLSVAKAKNWKDSLEMKKKNEFEMAKKRFLDDEMRRRQLDEEEKKYQNAQNDIIIQKARRQLFEEQDAVKSFNSKLLFCDTLKERDYQKEIQNRKKQINDIINKRFLENEKKKIEEYDKKIELKKILEEEKRKEIMNAMREQLQESKIKIIQDYQERLVEGRLMKINMQKALEEEKKLAELKDFEANERLKKEKQLKEEKELAEEKKIELFAIKKQQRDDLRKKVEDQKIKDKLDMHQKLIDVQLNNLMKIQKEKEDAFNRAIEANSKQKEENDDEKEKLNQQKKNKILQEIKEHMINSQKEKEEKKLKEKQEDINYIEDFKKKLAFLEGEENNERLAKKQKEKDLADYRRLQTEEKRRIALNDFEQINEDNYKQLKRLEMEDDDFIKYAEYWIQEYKRQGKNITPLLLELKRYKKNYSLY